MFTGMSQCLFLKGDQLVSPLGNFLARFSSDGVGVMAQAIHGVACLFLQAIHG